MGPGGSARAARARRHRPGDAGGRAVDLLLAPRHHHLVFARLHARGHRGPALQAARLHQDLLDRLRVDPRHHADAGAGRAAHPRQGARTRTRNPINRWLTAAYAPVVRFVVDHRWKVVVAALRSMVLTAPAVLRLEQRVHAAAQRGRHSLHADGAAGHERERSGGHPAVDGPRAQEVPRGRERLRQDGPLRDRDGPGAARHGRGHRRAQAARPSGGPGSRGTRFVKEMDEKLHYPGMPNVWWMPIQTRTEMLATGVRSPLGIEVFGDDLDAIEKAAISVEHAVAKVPGTRSAFAERSTGGFYIDFDVDREEAARHGLSVEDVNMVVAQSIGGENVSGDRRGRERVPHQRALRARVPRRPRASRIARSSRRPSGRQIPLSQVATIRERPRTADDPERGRKARRLRLRRHRPSDRRLRRRGEAGRRPRRQVAPGAAPRVGGAVQVLRAGEGAAEVGHPADAGDRVRRCSISTPSRSSKRSSSCWPSRSRSSARSGFSTCCTTT